MDVVNSAKPETEQVLVVDDNPMIANVLRGILEKEGYKITCCSNGIEALCALEERQFDVIICDVMMPKMDGHSFYKELQKDQDLSNIPFIFLTALDNGNDIMSGKEQGVDDYLVKPFQPADVISVVKGKIKRSKLMRKSSDARYDAYRKKVIHTLSHEFRTPLVAINTGAELLLSQAEGTDLEDRFSKLLEAIKRGGERLESLVNDFMLFQQIEAGVAKRMFDSRASQRSIKVIYDFIEQERTSLEQLGFQVNVQNSCTNLKVHMYEVQIFDVIKRLLSNAVKFQKQKKIIDIHLYPQGDEVVISVRDHGIGIDVQKIKEALGIFGQINRERMEQQGGGLGLAIANHYIEMHGGRLEIENCKDYGARFSVVLPRVN